MAFGRGGCCRLLLFLRWMGIWGCVVLLFCGLVVILAVSNEIWMDVSNARWGE
jgi:hypothetical protein